MEAAVQVILFQVTPELVITRAAVELVILALAVD